MRVTWNVYDLKISYKDASGFTKMITYIESFYAHMTVKYGKDHRYIGMEMDFSDRGTVKVSLTGYIYKAID